MKMTDEQVEVLPEDTRTLIEAGYINESSLLPTDRGTRRLVRVLFQDDIVRPKLVEHAAHRNQVRADRRKQNSEETTE